MLRERAVEGDDDGVGEHLRYQAAVVARTSLKGTRCRSLLGFDQGQLLLDTSKPFAGIIPPVGWQALAPTELFLQALLRLEERLAEQLLDGLAIRNFGQRLFSTGYAGHLESRNERVHEVSSWG